MAVNDSHALAPYRQAALGYPPVGIACLSGVVQVEANVPYVQWLGGVFAALSAQTTSPRCIGAEDLTGPLAEQWSEWLPAYGLWIRVAAPAVPDGTEQPDAGVAILFARDYPWSEHEISLLAEWLETWCHARRALQSRPRGGFLRGLRAWTRAGSATQGWRRPGVLAAGAAAAVLLFPVRLTVLAPGELVPARPAVVRAPLDGVIDTIHVEPNQRVHKDELLFDFDQALIRSRLEVASQGLSTAEAEYRQTVQQALSDEASKTQLVLLRGKIEERRSEAEYLREQLTRAQVTAPRDGIVLFDDPSEWSGRPVAVGERVMRIANPDAIEIEAWIPVADAIPVSPSAPVSLYLNASPFDPVEGTLRYIAHDAVERPDGSWAYRLRATLEAPTGHRIGLKGTAKLQGSWVVVGYWMLRRPVASLRASIGW